MSTFTLYRFFAADDTLLYVGLTINPGRRMEKHIGTKAWWRDVALITMEQHVDHASLRTAERTAIRTEAPLHNVRMNQHRDAIAEGCSEWRDDTEDWCCAPVAYRTGSGNYVCHDHGWPYSVLEKVA